MPTTKLPGVQQHQILKASLQATVAKLALPRGMTQRTRAPHPCCFCLRASSCTKKRPLPRVSLIRLLLFMFPPSSCLDGITVWEGVVVWSRVGKRRRNAPFPLALQGCFSCVLFCALLCGGLAFKGHDVPIEGHLALASFLLGCPIRRD